MNSSRLYESDGKAKFLETENKQLRRDKELLMDHVAELQRQVNCTVSTTNENSNTASITVHPRPYCKSCCCLAVIYRFVRSYTIIDFH